MTEGDESRGGRTPRPWPRPPVALRASLRAKVTLTFAGGALLLSAVLSTGTYLVVRDYLVEQRERVASNGSFADAAYVRAGLLTQQREVSDVLGEVAPVSGSAVLLRRGPDDWYSTSIRLSKDVVPGPLVDIVDDGRAGVAWTTVNGEPAVVVGVAMPAVDASFYEVAVVTELDRTLSTLAAVLLAFAGFTGVGGAVLGRWATRRTLAPLQTVAGTTGRIADGDLATRLEPSDDPDLEPIVRSFNRMVDALQERIVRDTRFNADVSHELRSPLTTLTTSVRVLERRRDELSATGRDALDLVVAELARFRKVLDALLELGRLDAGAGEGVTAVVDARALVREALAVSGRAGEIGERVALTSALEGEPESRRLAHLVRVDKLRASSALVNLFDNADLHGDGLVDVRVRTEPGIVLVEVDDDGPGVPPADRERVFERFVRAGSRGSLPGAGLGLSLVAETVRAHGGTVRCTDRPGGGARFEVRLPRAPYRSADQDEEGP